MNNKQIKISQLNGTMEKVFMALQTNTWQTTAQVISRLRSPGGPDSSLTHRNVLHCLHGLVSRGLAVIRDGTSGSDPAFSRVCDPVRKGNGAARKPGAVVVDHDDEETFSEIVERIERHTRAFQQAVAALSGAAHLLDEICDDLVLLSEAHDADIGSKPAIDADVLEHIRALSALTNSH